MASLALTLAGDLDISSGNIVVLTDPASLVAQRLRARFRMFLGEWFLDTRLGVPYRQLVLVKNPNLTVIRTLFRRVIETCPGVKTIDLFELDYDPGARRAAFTFRVTTDLGAKVVGGSGTPFIVEAT